MDRPDSCTDRELEIKAKRCLEKALKVVNHVRSYLHTSNCTMADLEKAIALLQEAHLILRQRKEK